MTFDQISWPRRTDRLTIRPADTADLPAVFAVRSRKDVAEWMPDHPTSYDDWLLHLGARGAFERMLVMELDGVVIGDLYLHVQDAWTQAEVKDEGKRGQAEIGWCLSPDHQGRGYVTEAAAAVMKHGFEVLGLNRIEAHHLSRNPASGRVMQKLGMTWEGRARQHVKKWGKYEDVEAYSILRQDYRG